MAAPAADKSLPDITIFPNLNVVIRTPAGREYRGEAREHSSREIDGEKWYQVVRLNPTGKDNQHDNAILRQEFEKAQRKGREHGRPDYFPEGSNAEPLKLNLNRIPFAKRHAKNEATLIGEFWDADGLWTVLASPSKSEKVLYAGSLVPSRAELDYPDSKISQYRQGTRPGQMAREAAAAPDAANEILKTTPAKASDPAPRTPASAAPADKPGSSSAEPESGPDGERARNSARRRVQPKSETDSNPGPTS
jgi:hypothetical protein